MGYAHIVWIHEDAIRDAYPFNNQPTADHETTAAALGKTVLKLCLDPDIELTPEGRRVPVRGADLIGHAVGNAVNHEARVHSTWTNVFVWSGNCLQSIENGMTDRALQAAIEILTQEQERRRQEPEKL